MFGGGGDEVSIMPVVYPCGPVSVSPLGYFSSAGSSSKAPKSPLSISLRARHIEDYFKKNRGRKRKFINTQEEKARREERRKKMRMTVLAKLVVGFWELTPMESVAYNSAEQDTSTVTKENEEPTEKRKITS